MVRGILKKFRSRKNACLRILVITVGFMGMVIWALVMGLLLRPNLEASDDRSWGYVSVPQLLLNLGYILCTSVIIYSVKSKTFPSAHDLESVRANVAWLVGLVCVGTAECIALFFLPEFADDRDGSRGVNNRITVLCSLSFIWAIFVAAAAWGLHQRFYTVMMRRMSVIELAKQAKPYPTKDAHSAVFDSSRVHITPLVHGPPPIIINTDASVSPKAYSPADTRTPSRSTHSHVIPYPPNISPTHTPLPTPTGLDSSRPSGQPFPSPQNPGQVGALSPSTNRGAPPLPYGFHSPC